MAFLKKFFGTSRDSHKSAIKFSKIPPLKIFLNPHPPPNIFGQAYVRWQREINLNVFEGLFISLVVSTSRQIEIEIENVLSVETNF
jgi:hypothetical protein